jgi:hypothetical protein
MRNLSRKALCLAAVAASATLGVAATGTPAFAAAQNASVYTTEGHKGGMGNFAGDASRSSSKERWNACDHRKDGYWTVTTLKWGTNHKYSVTDKGENDGVCKLRDDVNVPEETKVTITVCLQKGTHGALKYCKSATGRA